MSTKLLTTTKSHRCEHGKGRIQEAASSRKRTSNSIAERREEKQIQLKYFSHQSISSTTKKGEDIQKSGQAIKSIPRSMKSAEANKLLSQLLKVRSESRR
jgi:hypothetical protein